MGAQYVATCKPPPIFQAGRPPTIQIRFKFRTIQPTELLEFIHVRNASAVLASHSVLTPRTRIGCKEPSALKRERPKPDCGTRWASVTTPTNQDTGFQPATLLLTPRGATRFQLCRQAPIHQI